MVSYKKILSVLAGCSMALGDAAPVVTDSPKGAKYVANFNKTLHGSVEFSSAANGSVLVGINVDNFPSTGGPFAYHIHEAPVPSDGNCTGTKLHLNPYHGDPNATTPSEFEVGDLSAKHGVIEGTSLHTSFVDEYISLNENNEAFVGGLAVTFHYKNNNRLACANITSNGDSTTPVATASENAGTARQLPYILSLVGLGLLM